MIMKTYEIGVFIVTMNYNALTLIAFFDYFSMKKNRAEIPVIGIRILHFRILEMNGAKSCDLSRDNGSFLIKL